MIGMITIFLFIRFIFFADFRDMHAFECGPNFVGLCENMTSINGETLLKFLRNVTFTGIVFVEGLSDY